MVNLLISFQKCDIRPTWAEVNTANIASNLKYIKGLLPQDTQIMAVVKANAYGHGAVECAMVALENGASYLGVSIMEEGIELRRAGIAAPILILGHIFPWNAREAVKLGLTCMVATLDLAESLSSAAMSLGKKAKVHVKVDTGMGRIGLSPEEVLNFVTMIYKLPGLEIEGICSHLGTVDSDRDLALKQIEKFEDLMSNLENNGYFIPVRHIANSAAAMTVPQASMNMVRVGMAMYGLSYTGTSIAGPELKPALAFKTCVEYVKEVQEGSTIGYNASYISGREQIVTLPVGYADGYPRLLSNKGKVLINGEKFKVVGKVCMDQMMVSVPIDFKVDIGDEVVLIGDQKGKTIHAEDLALDVGTINYEIVCRITTRVPRVYINKFA